MTFNITVHTFKSGIFNFYITIYMVQAYKRSWAISGSTSAPLNVAKLTRSLLVEYYLNQLSDVQLHGMLK